MSSGRPADEQRRYEQLFEDFSVRDVGHPQIRSRVIIALASIAMLAFGITIVDGGSSTADLFQGASIVVIGSLLALKSIDEIACFAFESHTCNQCRRDLERWEPDE